MTASHKNRSPSACPAPHTAGPASLQLQLGCLAQPGLSRRPCSPRWPILLAAPSGQLLCPSRAGASAGAELSRRSARAGQRWPSRAWGPALELITELCDFHLLGSANVKGRLLLCCWVGLSTKCKTFSQEKEEIEGIFLSVKDMVPELESVLPFTSHWLELSLMTRPGYRGIWEM